MLTGALDRIRLAIQRSRLKRIVDATGINTAGKKLYEGLILSSGKHTSTILGHRITFRVSSTREIYSINNLHGEQEFLQRMLDASRPSDVLYDVGANIGLVSLLLADRFRGSAFRAEAFEPEPQNFGHLTANIALNRVEAHIDPQRLGLGQVTGVARLFVEGEVGTGQHTIVSETAAGRDAIEIQLVSAADFAASHRPPDTLKIDVEGAEMEVLLGCESLFRARQIREVFLEVHLGRIFTRGFATEAEVVQWMKDRGMGLAWRQQRGGEVLQHYTRNA